MSGQNMSKQSEYAELVARRKACSLCPGLTNPSMVEGGRYDSDEIGPWSRWQGNLDAQLMVVGQDWGDMGFFIRNAGIEPQKNTTNTTLVELIGLLGITAGPPGAAIGQDVGFFTNAILCLKQGGLQAAVQGDWFRNCSVHLRRQIEIVGPKVVIGLGERAYRSILAGFDLKIPAFRTQVEDSKGILLPTGSLAFAVYHCGTRIQNTHRSLDIQRQDWMRIQPRIRA
jgi:uracil-DNA glycosylase